MKRELQLISMNANWKNFITHEVWTAYTEVAGSHEHWKKAVMAFYLT